MNFELSSKTRSKTYSRVHQSERVDPYIVCKIRQIFRVAHVGLLSLAVEPTRIQEIREKQEQEADF